MLHGGVTSAVQQGIASQLRGEFFPPLRERSCCLSSLPFPCLQKDLSAGSSHDTMCLGSLCPSPLSSVYCPVPGFSPLRRQPLLAHVIGRHTIQARLCDHLQTLMVATAHNFTRVDGPEHKLLPPPKAYALLVTSWTFLGALTFFCFCCGRFGRINSFQQQGR